MTTAAAVVLLTDCLWHKHEEARILVLPLNPEVYGDIEPGHHAIIVDPRKPQSQPGDRLPFSYSSNERLTSSYTNQTSETTILAKLGNP